VYNTADSSWQALAPVNIERVVHTSALLPDGRILITGGELRDHSMLSSVEVLNP
jgi:type II secretory pathway component GspD/PulD (secretin)